MTRIGLAALLPVAAWMTTGQTVSEADREAITKTALNYGQGWYDGDAERMESALHPDLAKRALMPAARSPGGKIDHMSAMGLVQATRRGGGKRTPADVRKTNVTILDIFGKAATAKLEMHDWVDYMHLSKIGDRWLIVNVLWEFTPEAKKKYGFPEDL